MSNTRQCAEDSLESIVGRSPWVERIREDIRHVAPYPTSVLVTGPSGSGKELVARAVHAMSPRAEAAFIPIDCASITGTLFASHMFGHVKGAFTGADYDAMGGFRAADGGTIFLDEIGELELDLQAKLLRVLQQRMVVPVGSFQGIPVDVRLVAATNRDLAAEVAARRFREDLYYRLNVVSLVTLPLRERKDDIEVLARSFLAKSSVRLGIPLRRLSRETLDCLVRYDWPGNVRQLENVLEHAELYSDGPVIHPDALPDLDFGDPSSAGDDNSESTQSSAAVADSVLIECGGADDSPLGVDPSPSAKSTELLSAADSQPWPAIRDLERDHILRTLEKTFYNQSAAARLLGIDRNLLRRKIRRYGIDISRSKPGRPRRSQHDPRRPR